MTFRKYQNYFIIVALIGSAALTMWVFRHYLVPLAIGGVIAVVARPLYFRINRFLKSSTASSFLTMVVVLSVIVLPLTYFIIALTTEIAGLIVDMRGRLGITEVTAWLERTLPVNWQGQIPAVVDQLTNFLQMIAGKLSTSVVSLFSNIVGMVLDALVMFVAAYYLLKDGDRLKQELVRISPLRDSQDLAVIGRVTNSVRAVITGLLIVGLIKGVLSGLAFWAFGVPAPFFWGTMSGMAFFIPLVGSGLVTAPAVIYLLVTGHVAAAIGLSIVSIVVIGLVDNLLQPKLVQSKTNIHPLLVLLSIVGGLDFYGFAGFILGPLTLTVTLALLDIYEHEIRHLSELPPST